MIKVNDNKKWRLYNIFYGLILVSLAIVFITTFESMIQIWLRSETFAHGFLVAPITLWLIWRKKETLRTQLPSPNFYFFIPFLFFLLLWLLGSLTYINSVTQFSAIGLIVVSVPLVYGWGTFKTIIFPLFFLFFSVPAGEFLLPQLMDWTAAFTITALRFSGVPVYQEGLRFIISSGSWSVVEACSGIRYLIASLTVGTLFSYINYSSPIKRIIFIGISIVVPVVANWFRAYMIVMLGHYSGNTLAVGVDHLIYGWVFFGIVITVMFILGSHWTDAQGTIVFKNIPAQVRLDSFSLNFFKLIFIFLLSICLLFVVFIFNKNLIKNNDVAVSPISAPNSLTIDWSLSGHPTFWAPVLPGISSNFNEIYNNKDGEVGLYVGYYGLENSSHKLVSSSNVVVDEKKKEWILLKTANININLNDENLPLKDFLLRDNVASQENYLLVRRIYWIDGRFISNDYEAKFYSAWSRFFSLGKLDSAVIYVYAYRGIDGSGEILLNNFLAKNIFYIQGFLSRFRNQRWALPELN